MVSNNVLTIGLTGGIGSGKSTVSKLFEELGVTVIDTDEIARDVVLPGSAALHKISEHFGKEFIAADGSLDRKKLGDCVFADAAKREWLEKLLHPLIWQEALRRARNNATTYSMIAVPLLLETAAAKQVDRVLVVDCTTEQQIQRATSRDGRSKDRVAEIMASQLPREERLRQADDVIDNSGTVEDLVLQVQKLHQRYQDLQS